MPHPRGEPTGRWHTPLPNRNLLADPEAETIVDDVASITQAIIVDEGDSRSRHWNDSARALLQGILLFTLALPRAERNLITVRQLLSLTHPALMEAVQKTASKPNEATDKEYFIQNRTAVETLLLAMAATGNRFAGILAGSGGASSIRRRPSAAASSRRPPPRPTSSTASRCGGSPGGAISGWRPCAAIGL